MFCEAHVKDKCVNLYYPIAGKSLETGYRICGKPASVRVKSSSIGQEIGRTIWICEDCDLRTIA
jgi:hypothetical protein